MSKSRNNKTVIVNKHLINSGAILPILAAILIILKALEMTTLSWWAVTSPLWVIPALAAGILVFILALVAVVGIVCGAGYGCYVAFNYLSRKIRKE